jgi:hypothetical protein
MSDELSGQKAERREHARRVRTDRRKPDYQEAGGAKMVKTTNENGLPYVTGKVKRINVKGHGPNSGHIQFVVSGVTLLITGPPKKIRIPERENDGYEPYLFTAMANLIIAAYYARDEITVHYEVIAGDNFPREIDVPKLKKKKRNKKADVGKHKQ